MQVDLEIESTFDASSGLLDVAIIVDELENYRLVLRTGGQETTHDRGHERDEGIIGSLGWRVCLEGEELCVDVDGTGGASGSE